MPSERERLDYLMNTVGFFSTIIAHAIVEGCLEASEDPEEVLQERLARWERVLRPGQKPLTATDEYVLRTLLESVETMVKTTADSAYLNPHWRRFFDDD